MSLKEATAKKEMMMVVKEEEDQTDMAETTVTEAKVEEVMIGMTEIEDLQDPMIAIALVRKKENLEDKKQNLINHVIIS